MRSAVILVLCLIISHLSFSALSFAADENKAAAAVSTKITVLADPWCPFTCDKAKEGDGILIDVLKAALGSSYKIDYSTVNWSRAVEQTRMGKFDAIAGALKGDAPDFVFHKKYFAEQKSCFYTDMSSDWVFAGTPSLKDKTLGVVLDYSYGPPIDEYIKQNVKNNKAVDALAGASDTLNKMASKLVAKRISVMIEDKSVMGYFLKNNPKFKLREAGCLRGQPLYVAFSPKKSTSKKFVDELDKALEKLMLSGEIDKIVAKYNSAAK